MVDYTSWAGIVISCSSLCVAIIALVKSAKTQDKTIELQQKLIQIEEGRDQFSLLKAKSAMLRAELCEFERNSYKLCIANDGASVARNIRVDLEGMPFLEHPVFIQGIEIPELIGPKSEIKFALAIGFGCAPPFPIRVFWDDDCRVNNSYETTLTFP